MSTGNQGRRNEGNRHGGQNGGSDKGDKGAAGQGPAQSFQQGAEGVQNRLREGYENVSDQAAHHYRKAEGTVARNPGSSVLIGFGVGVGLGLALTALLSQREESLADRYLPDEWSSRLPSSLRSVRASDVRSRARDVRDRAGDLRDRAGDHAETIQTQLGSLADSLRDLPSILSRYLPKG